MQFPPFIVFMSSIPHPTRRSSHPNPFIPPKTWTWWWSYWRLVTIRFVTISYQQSTEKYWEVQRSTEKYREVRTSAGKVERAQKQDWAVKMQFPPFIVFMSSVRCSIPHPTWRSSHPNPFIAPKCYIRHRQSSPSRSSSPCSGFEPCRPYNGSWPSRENTVHRLPHLILVTRFLINHNNLIIHHIFSCHLTAQ